MIISPLSTKLIVTPPPPSVLEYAFQLGARCSSRPCTRYLPRASGRPICMNRFAASLSAEGGEGDAGHCVKHTLATKASLFLPERGWRGYASSRKVCSGERRRGTRCLLLKLPYLLGFRGPVRKFLSVFASGTPLVFPRSLFRTNLLRGPHQGASHLDRFAFSAIRK